jgi:hypothetical protein
MRCLLTRARRDGVPLTSKSTRPKPEEGTLEVLSSVQDTVLGRAVTVARFAGDRRHELINAELVRLTGDEMILSGLERRFSESGGRADYAQTWIVKLLL